MRVVLEEGLRVGCMDGVRVLNDRRMNVKVAAEHARNRNDWQVIVQVLICICCYHGATAFLGKPW